LFWFIVLVFLSTTLTVNEIYKVQLGVFKLKGFFSFLAYFGVRYFSSSARVSLQSLQLIFIVLVLFTFLTTALWMHANRPLQNVYFNQLAGEKIAVNWELDYWSLSNRQALDWILSKDSREQISIQTNDNSPLYDSAVFMSADDIGRVNFLWYNEGIENADYVIARQDLTPESRELRNLLNSRESGFRLAYKKTVGEAEIFAIYEKTS
jgi:Ca2+/Na+ antiporter